MTDSTIDLLELPGFQIGQELDDSQDPASLKRTLEEVEKEELEGWRTKTRKLGEMSSALAKKRESLRYNSLCLFH
jgi:hypothetical protein